MHDYRHRGVSATLARSRAFRNFKDKMGFVNKLKVPFSSNEIYPSPSTQSKYIREIDPFCVKFATYMLKSAQKINFTHLLKLFLKKNYSIRYVDSGKIIL